MMEMSFNKIKINNKFYELPEEVISYILKLVLKVDDLKEENEEYTRRMKKWK